MRIIAGSKKGRKLFDFDGRKIRPTTDRVKESVFNLIQEFIAGSTVLDLFGGSGALALEALSRGAESAVCVDIDEESVALINKNVKSTGFDNITVIKSDAMRYLDTAQRQFSVIFLDPPYNKGFIAPIIKKITECDILRKDGIIVLESDFSDEHSEFPGLEIVKQRKYGRSYVTIYQQGGI